MERKPASLKPKSISQQSGQGLVEYVALTALIAIVSIGAVKTFGGKVQKRLTQITTNFDNNIQQGLKSRHSGRSKSKKSGSGIFDELPLPGGMKMPSFSDSNDED